MNSTPSRPSLAFPAALLLVFLAFLLGGCETTDPSSDLRVYPTPAEKNQQLHERMGDSAMELR